MSISVPIPPQSVRPYSGVLPALEPAFASTRPLQAALPRNPLHIKLLEDNAPDIDLCLVRDPHMVGRAVEAFGERVIFLGRERRLTRTDFNLFAIRRANRRYYGGIGNLLARLPLGRLIVFLHTEPLEEFIATRLPPSRIEIWEEGLMHYVDLEGDLYRIRRRAMQRLCGFHVRRLRGTTMQRSRYRVRDRFREGSLTFLRPVRAEQPREEILFIGQPLVEDRLIPARAYARFLAELSAALPLPLRYLPHPREAAVERFSELARRGGLVIESGATRGVLEHCADFSYRALISPFSTALLDLGQPHRSFWVAPLMGLKGIGARLRRLEGFPIAIPADIRTLREAVCALMAPAPGVPASAAGTPVSQASGGSHD